jgi:hypothetical protein
MTKRRRGWPIMPQHSVIAVRPPGTNRQSTMSGIPNRSSERSAQARRRTPFGGRLTAASQPGQGTQMTLTLPPV